jgi:hypothetical protein
VGAAAPSTHNVAPSLLVGAGVDYAYGRRSPHWGHHHGASPSRSSGRLFGGAAPLPGRCVYRWCSCPEALLTCSMARALSLGRDLVVNSTMSRSWKASLGGAIAKRRYVGAASSLAPWRRTLGALWADIGDHLG